MRLHSGIATALAALAMLAPPSRSAGAQGRASPAARPEAIAPAPPIVAKVLVADSTVAARYSGDATAGVDQEHDCAPGLRDPRTGVTYGLVQTQRTQHMSPVTHGASVTTVSVQGNYAPFARAKGPTPPRIPPKFFLRVACGSNEVLGLARAFDAVP